MTEQVNGWVITGEARIAVLVDLSVEETTPEPTEDQDDAGLEDEETTDDEDSDEAPDAEEVEDPESEQSCTQLFFC